MGNFGKRLLIILISVAALVTLTLVGNAYQQAEKIHNVSDESETVIEGKYNNEISFKLSREDVFEAMMGSNALGSVEDYLLTKVLLKSVIESISDETLIQNKLNYLVYGTTDEDTIALYDEAEYSEKKAELWDEFYTQMEILGYPEDGEGEHSLNYYLRYMIAKDLYAEYRLENGLAVGDNSYSVTDEDIQEKYKEGYKDTDALVIKFYSEDDYNSYLKYFVEETGYRLTTVSSILRVFIGDTLYMPATNSDGLYIVGDDLELSELTLSSTQGGTEKITESNANKDYTYIVLDPENEGEEGEVLYVPFANTIYKEDEKAVYTTLYNTEDGEYAEGAESITGWKCNKTTTTTFYMLKLVDGVWKYGVVANYEDVDVTDEETQEVTTVKKWVFVESPTYTTDTLKCEWDYSDSYSTSNTAVMNNSQFLNLYIEMYNDYYQYQGKQITSSYDVSDFLDKYTGTDEEKANLLNADLNTIGYALVDGEIRKYVGDSEYVVKVVDGVAQSEFGSPLYETYGSDENKLPNYKLEVVDDELIYELDSKGERVRNDSYKEIKDVTTFDKSNTIEVTSGQLFSAYIQLYEDSLTYVYEDVIDGLSEDSDRYAFATELFDTMSVNEYYKTATDIDSDDDEYNPYYIIYKLSDSEITEDLDADSELYKEIKQELIDSYITDSSYVSMCMAELFKSAGITFFDNYLPYDFESDITYDSSSNIYGVEDEEDIEDYYTKGIYLSKRVAELKNKVSYEINGESYATEKYKLTSDELYDYLMDLRGSLFINNAALSQVLVNMKENAMLHGTYDNYLLSDNWRMEKYVSSTEQINYYYENYYSSYYDSVNELLYSQYGVKNFDRLIDSYIENTMRQLFVYKSLVGDLTTTELSESSLLDDYTVNSEKFQKISSDYLSIDIDHILIYPTVNDNDSTDSEYQETFLKSLEDGTCTLSYQDGDEVKTLTSDKWESLLDEIYSDLLSYIYKDETLSSSDQSVLEDYVDNYNNSIRFDDEDSDSEYNELYLTLKRMGITMVYQNVPTDTIEDSSYNIENYIQEWQDAAYVLEEKLLNRDADVTGYSIYDGFLETKFGCHFMVATKNDDTDLVSFKFTDAGYSESATNENDEITVSQLALYIQNSVYSTLFGSSSKCEEYAEETYGVEFKYPAVPSKLAANIETLYGSYLDTLTDSSSGTYSTFLMASYLNEGSYTNKTDYSFDFETIKEYYSSQLFD